MDGGDQRSTGCGGIEAKKGEVDQANAKWDQAQKAVGGTMMMMMQRTATLESLVVMVGRGEKSNDSQPERLPITF